METNQSSCPLPTRRWTLKMSQKIKHFNYPRLKLIASSVPVNCNIVCRAAAWNLDCRLIYRCHIRQKKKEIIDQKWMFFLMILCCLPTLPHSFVLPVSDKHLTPSIKLATLSDYNIVSRPFNRARRGVSLTRSNLRFNVFPKDAVKRNCRSLKP